MKRWTSTLSHVSLNGKLNMVNVSDKTITKRIAIASGKVLLGKEAFQLIKANKLQKGDVLTVAKIAGIQGAKMTSSLIPLCHPLTISQVKVDLELRDDEFAIDIKSQVTCTGQTGVEMEAIMAVSVAACTIYDMAKAVNKAIEITGIKLLAKSGGKSGEYKC
jgi:cyclic pyranopterin phosphate synthase